MTTITMEEYELMKDSKYRMYVAAVDKALKNFEYTSEWADLIAALGKLNKVLLSYTKFPVIPRRIKISKRLAQCMHPALPSGVHLKALETYDIIFKCMGTNRLSMELFIYSAGLFPLLGHAAMNIRPSLLTVYETHFVPLRERLRPALSGFLSGVLPGLEVGSDYFDRTNILLENVCEGVGPGWFYTCIWQCVRSNSPVRLPAISYILSHYSRKVSMEDQLYLMGNDIDVMVSGLCAAVYDSSILVQRSALDLLMVCFPMNNTQLLYADMVRVVTAALTTILRRDMSLNRRLYCWLLNSEVNTTTQYDQTDKNENEIPEISSPTIAYDLILEALRVILKEKSTEIPLNVTPYRLLTSLFEKPQIGPAILDHILYDIFRSIYLTCLHQQRHKNSSVRCVSFNGDLTSLNNTDNCILTKQFITKNCQELVKHANLLFNTLQCYYIWAYIERCFEKAVENVNKSIRDKIGVNEIGSGEPSLLEICLLTEFLLDIIPIETYSQNTYDILPNLFKKIMQVLEKHVGILNKTEITTSLEMCMHILMKIQPIVVKPCLNKPEFYVNLSEEDKKDDSSPDAQVLISGEKEVKVGLEKSKSDSKINENLNKNELNVEDTARERSNSNQMGKKKASPKIDKKTKNKKSKSSSKLYDFKKEESNDAISEVVLDKSEPLQHETIEANQTVKHENKHIVLCLKAYKKFLITFVQLKIIPDVAVEKFFNTLVRDKEERTKKLQDLLLICLSSYNSLNRRNFHIKEYAFDVGFEGIDVVSEYEKAMTVACDILQEFATFPNLLNESRERSCPFWLRVLVVVACCTKSSQSIILTTINALLDIFSLSKSQNYEKKIGDGNSNVIVTGVLECFHVHYIEENTVVLKVICQILWHLLGCLTNQNQIMLCVTLLYQMHNVFNNESFVEDVISQYLTEENLNTECFKRFILLLHLGRDLNIKLPTYQNTVRNFDKCLLKILDNLQNFENANIKLLSETFLTHSLLRNDIARILNPILLKLLTPSTSRISIRNINIQDADLQLETNFEDVKRMDDAKAKKIYAISNVNGNVMYHVTDGPSPKPQKRKWYLFNKTNKKFTQVVNMTTSVTDSSSVVTKKNKDFKNYDASPSIESGGKNQVKLFINPLSSKEIYPIGLDGSYTKIDPNSQKSSSDSLSSSNDLTHSDSLKNFDCKMSQMSQTDRDSGFESYDYKSLSSSETKKNILEHIEPISEGIKDRKSIENCKLSKSQSFDEKRTEKLVEMENLSLVHSWSYCISDSDNLNAELELSTSAEDFFKGTNDTIVREILHDIIDKVCSDDLDADCRRRPTDLDLKTGSFKKISLYPMHQHMCLYCEVFDCGQVLYALHTLKNCLVANPQLFIKCLATTSLKDSKNCEISCLLARHRKSVLGCGFSGELSQEHLNFYRGYMFLDVVILICLNYIRSYFFHEDPSLTEEDIASNLQIQLKSLEILDIIVKNLINIVNENVKGFGGYIADMLLKCKLQKVLLHCLLTSVRNFDKDMSFAEEVLLFNNFKLYDTNKRLTEHVEGFQIQLLRLIHSLIILEYHVFPQEPSVSSQQPATPTTGEHLTYTPTILIPQQNMFLSAILSALRHNNMKNLHQNWCNMVTSSLPYFGENLKQICMSVVHQICNNIERIADNYKSDELAGELCSDYATTQLESLTILCHYCLLDSSQNVPTSTNAPVTNPSEIFNNLVNVFFSPIGCEIKQNADYYQIVRQVMLSHMPRIIASVAKLWQTIVSIEGEYNGVFGNSKIVKQQLMEFLSPISVHHSASFLAAIAVAWHERRNPFTNVKTILPEPNTSQSNLVYLISAIRVIPLDNLVQTVIAVIKNPPPIEGLNSDICLDVSVLELFYCYMRNASATQLSEAWGSLLTLFRESCSLSPPAQFLIAALLHEIMIKCCPLEERKDQKDLQDVTAKLIESVSQVCGSCLQQTTWLRRNLAVKEQDEDSISSVSVVTASNSDILTGINNNYSVQAQLVLSEILAPILDICFGSSEKDKVNTILTSLMCNIVPYLKTHTVRNMSSFNACLKLLASLSSYQYTRKAWKKDVFDLLLDNCFFQIDYSCLKYWRVIVDHLMTHDNTTFKDLMSRVSMTQSGSLSIFSSREQELEQRAQLLKRLAFVIFCSEVDQYAKYMPDIQEQLTTSLRLSAPNVQAQVFLCFRVLLIRMSPLQVTSLWPIIISEMLQVFLQMEQQLNTDTEEFSSHIKLLSGLDVSWVTNSNNGLNALGNPHWLQLQLATAKLLDLSLLLPATALPQFQMYRWAFVEDDLSEFSPEKSHCKPTFTPHVKRIASSMDQKFQDTQIETMSTKQNELLLTMNTISQLKDLHGYFRTLSLCSNRHRTDCSDSVSSDYMMYNKVIDKTTSFILEKVDKVIGMDFLDKIPR